MVKIVVDSSSDIPRTVADSLDITIIPARILFGRKVYLDGLDLTASDFYNELKKTKYHPLTTPASPTYMFKVFRDLEELGEDILFIGISPKLSQFMDNAKIAFENITRVNWRLYDSTGTSMYLGLLGIQAAKMAQMGYTLNQITTRLDLLGPRTTTYAIAVTFDYLIRGGRVPITKGKLASALRVTPIIEINNGETHAISTPKGLSSGIKEIIRLLKQLYSQEEPLICAILDAENAIMAAEMTNQIASNFNITEFIPAKIGAAIGANVGPGAIAVAMTPSLQSVL